MSDDRQLEITIDVVKPPTRGRRRRVKPPQPEPVRIPRIRRLLALAIKFQDMIDRGEVRDYADLARLGYVTRARITQIMNLLNLAPEIQEQILLPKSPNVIPCERHLRRIVTLPYWKDQRLGRADFWPSFNKVG